MNELSNPRNITTIASEINTIKDQTNKLLLQSSIEIGKRLTEAKELVGHGNWTKWLETEVSYSQRTAQNLMKIHEEYGLKMIEKSNTQSIANLGYTQAVAMLKLDFEDRENFVLEHDLDELTVKEFEEAIRDKKALEIEKEELKIQLEEANDKESAHSLEIQEKLNKIEEAEKLIKEKNKEMQELKEIIEANTKKADEVDTSELDAAREDVKKKREEIRQLKEKLKEKPKEVEVEVEKEVVPENIKEEMDTLKLKLEEASTKINSNESIYKFRSMFAIIVDLFNDLVNELDNINVESPEEYTKYKNALNKFLEKLIVD